MIDLPILTLLQKANRLTLYNSARLQLVICNEVTIYAISIRCISPYDKTIRIGIRSRYPARVLVLQGFFVIQILIAGTRFDLDEYLYHADL